MSDVSFLLPADSYSGKKACIHSPIAPLNCKGILKYYMTKAQDYYCPLVELSKSTMLSIQCELFYMSYIVKLFLLLICCGCNSMG